MKSFQSRTANHDPADSRVSSRGATSDAINTSPRQVAQRQALAGLFGSAIELQQETPEEFRPKSSLVAQRQGLDEGESLQGEDLPPPAALQVQDDDSSVVPDENRTGMPDQLKVNLEAMSGFDLSDVRVHRNSDRPAQLNALAYAQGNEIHLAPGQEQHLPHEAWHVVQQRQGRVAATMQMAGIGVNNEPALEREADEKAFELGTARGPNVSYDNNLVENEGIEGVGGLGGEQLYFSRQQAAQREQFDQILNNGESNERKYLVDEVASSLKEILGSIGHTTHKDLGAEMAAHIRDLQVLAKDGSCEVNGYLLDALDKEAQEHCGMTLMDAIARAKFPEDPAIRGTQVVQRVLGTEAIVGITVASLGGVALLAAGIFKIIKRLWFDRPHQYELADQEEGNFELSHVSVRPRKIFVLQGCTATGRAGDYVQNSYTAGCGLVLGFGESGVAVFHWPGMVNSEEHFKTFETVLNEVGPLKSIRIITNNPKVGASDSTDHYVGTAKAIQRTYNVTTRYFVHREGDDESPTGTLGDDEFLSIHSVTEMLLSQ